MNTITKIVVLVSLCLIVSKAHAQDTIQKTTKTLKIENLERMKQTITNEEKDLLKAEVEVINQRLENGEITKETSEVLKQDAAKKRALNIENRLAIIDNQIALEKRNETTNPNYEDDGYRYGLTLGGDDLFRINTPDNKKTPKYDLRTTNRLLFAIGLNNTLIDGQNLDDSPYKIGGSGFVELGYLWKTRLLESSNFVRITYGVSFQWNKLKLKDNMYFVDNGDETTLVESPLDLKKSKFRTTSLVIPLHFEFGPSKRKDYGDRIRYFTEDQFKIGIGGFAGVNLSTLQKLKYEDNGDDRKDKIKKDFNTTNFVYGMSGYIGVGDFSVYVKYNLNELFKDQAVDQHNVSLGLRWDFD